MYPNNFIFFAFVTFIISFMYGVGAILTSYISLKGFVELNSLIKGVISGFIISLVYILSFKIPYIGGIVFLVCKIYLIAIFTIFFISIVINIFKGGVKIKNTFKILLGNFYFDDNNTFFKSIIQGIIRHTWEIPNTIIGQTYSQFKNIIGDEVFIEYFGGITYNINKHLSKMNGICIGSFVCINSKQKDYKDIFIHEYGHTFDSRLFGPFYLIIIGIPSIISAYKSNNLCKHNLFWTERRANKHSKKYFNKKYGNNFDKSYLTLKNK